MLMKANIKHKNNPGLLLILGILFITAIPGSVCAQAGLNTDGSQPDQSSMLDLKSTEMGFLPPRMTTAQRNAIASPAEGLVIYNTDNKAVELFNGTIWTSNSGEFVCNTSQVADADGNVYNTVLIGNQCWMKENLRTGTQVTGTTEQTDNGIIEKYCYNDDPGSCAEYGGLYTWAEMMNYTTGDQVEGICPSGGWHVPTVAEYNTLLANLPEEQARGDQMKETGTAHWQYSSISHATNVSGFTAVGAGYRVHDGSFNALRMYNILLTSDTETTTAFCLVLGYDMTGVSTQTYPEDDSFSLRCVKN